MFALAWHDTRTRRTVLARDHFGVKPLHYCYTDDGLLFASEAQALLATGLIRPEVDPAEFVLRSWVRMDAADEHTWLSGIRALQPAEYLVVDAPRVRLRRYWQPEPSDEVVGAEEIRAAFDRSVALRSVADVPRAAVLSGGVDSSAIFSALHTGGVEVAPYVAHYEDGIGGSGSDVDHARLVSGAHGVPLTVCELSRRDAVTLVPEVAHRLMRPLLHGAELAMYQLYRRISAEGQVVVYSGHGADEMWGYQDGGYFPVVDPAAATHVHGRHYLTHRLHRDERPLWGELIEWLARELGVDMDDIRQRVWDRVLREYRALDTLDPLKRGRHHLMRRFLVYVNDMVDLTSSAYTRGPARLPGRHPGRTRLPLPGTSQEPDGARPPQGTAEIRARHPAAARRRPAPQAGFSLAHRPRLRAGAAEPGGRAGTAVRTHRPARSPSGCPGGRGVDVPGLQLRLAGAAADAGTHPL